MKEILNRLSYRKLQFLLAILIVLFLSSFFLVFFKNAQAYSRDAKRRADISQIVKALDLYHDKHGYYPKENSDDNQGWENSITSTGSDNNNFLSILKKEKFIDHIPFDPINNVIYYYRYQRFTKEDTGCKNFYILQITNFEKKSKNKGSGQCKDIDFTKLSPNGYTIQKFE